MPCRRALPLALASPFHPLPASAGCGALPAEFCSPTGPAPPSSTYPKCHKHKAAEWNYSKAQDNKQFNIKIGHFLKSDVSSFLDNHSAGIIMASSWRVVRAPPSLASIHQTLFFFLLCPLVQEPPNPFLTGALIFLNEENFHLVLFNLLPTRHVTVGSKEGSQLFTTKAPDPFTRSFLDVVICLSSNCSKPFKITF